jgi:hypothetical protein
MSPFPGTTCYSCPSPLHGTRGRDLRVASCWAGQLAAIRIAQSRSTCTDDTDYCADGTHHVIAPYAITSPFAMPGTSPIGRAGTRTPVIHQTSAPDVTWVSAGRAGFWPQPAKQAIQLIAILPADQPPVSAHQRLRRD